MVALLIVNGQNLSKVKEVLIAKKYSDANTQLDEFINNPKYQKNADYRDWETDRKSVV